MKIRREFEDTKQILSVNNGNIFLFELAFRLLTLPLLLQMTGALVRLALNAAGYSYVTVNKTGYACRSAADCGCDPDWSDDRNR